jgi:hypothetical protein
VTASSASRGRLIVPPPPPAAPSWQERLLLDVRKQWALSERLNLTFSDRFNLREEDDIHFPCHENVINNWREGFFSWEPVDRTYLDAGRINLKSGAALGFNPTDFFKTRAVVEPLSADPSVLREDRLGTLMMRTQQIWQGGAITAAFAPKISEPSPLYTNTDLPSFNPSFDRTNARDRLLLKGSANIAGDFNPELLIYHESDRTQLGANLTRGLGANTVAYVEWAGGDRSSLIEEALRYGRETGTLPVGAPNVLPADPRVYFQNDLAAGGSYTTESKVTFNFEYHFHEAGFSGQDWRNWFAIGAGTSSSSPVARELWFIRGYALDQQEPIAKNSIFLRADWLDAFVPDLEITGFVNADLRDGSSLVQIEADYYRSNRWTFGAQVSADLGGKRTDFGSLPQVATILLKAARYF